MSANQPHLYEKKGEFKQSQDLYTSNAPFKSKGKQTSNAFRKTSQPEDFSYYNKEHYSNKFEFSTFDKSSQSKKNSFFKEATKHEIDPFVFNPKLLAPREVSIDPALSSNLSSHDFYKQYLNKIKNTQNFIFDKEMITYFTLDSKLGRLPNNSQSQDCMLKENTETNNQLNESISTTHSAYTTTIHSPKKALSRQTIKMIYDGYLETNYPEISTIQQRYANPYTNIEVKKNSIYFIIKSFNIENIHKAIKYGVWSTTYSGNIIFDKAFSLAQSRNAEVYLFFSTNSTFAFQGIARLKSKFQTKTYSFWKGSEKYKSFNGSFNLDWLIIKDVPNSTLDKIQVNNIPFSKLRNGVELNEKDALNAIGIFRNFYYCSSLVLSDFMRLDIEEKNHTHS